MIFAKKVSPRRKEVRKAISAERSSRLSQLAQSGVIGSILLWIVFVCAAVAVLSYEKIYQADYFQIIWTAVVVILVSLAAAFYIYNYQWRIIERHTRALAIIGVYILFLTIAKLGLKLSTQSYWAIGTVATVAIVLTIAYDRRFAILMSMFYAILACFAVDQIQNTNTFLIMTTGVFTFCFSLKEIRTRMKLLEVSTLAAVVVFLMATALGFMDDWMSKTEIFTRAGTSAGAVFGAGLLMQALLPLIEKVFNIVTSMTLLDYSDANQPLLKKLAMEAPGTFSHSLLVGTIAEAAAEEIGANGLLCRVGAYYHDIGKINKSKYFVENQIGSASSHDDLSPTMSQLIIVGHVKDGVEMAKEYKLPPIIRQFIETHHGTNLIEYFYHEAKKKQDDKQAPPAESEFRYTGPKPQTKEAAIVMLADAIEGAVRSLPEVTPTKIEAVVHNIAMKRLQDGQFNQCDMSMRELNIIEASISKTLTGHYHGRVAYPDAPDEPLPEQNNQNQNNNQ